MSGASTSGPPFQLNLGGEGEVADSINQQPPWVDLTWAIARNGLPLRTLTTAGVPVLFCDNTNLCFPDSIIDIVYTNGVPVDLGATWLGPSISSGEIKRILKSRGQWYDNGVLVNQKP
jgi:hypothetical protein